MKPHLLNTQLLTCPQCVHVSLAFICHWHPCQRNVSAAPTEWPHTKSEEHINRWMITLCHHNIFILLKYIVHVQLDEIISPPDYHCWMLIISMFMIQSVLISFSNQASWCIKEFAMLIEVCGLKPFSPYRLAPFRAWVGHSAP